MISILIPNYNNKLYLEAAIESVLMQKDIPYEIIVADGASTDGSVDILKKYDSKIRWISEPDSGQSDALLKAYKLSKGNIIGWLNSDEIFASDEALKVAYNELINSPKNIGATYGDLKYIDAEGKYLTTIKSHPYDYKKMLRGRYIPLQPTVFFKKHVLDEVGFVSRDFKWSMDFELYSRIGAKYDFKYIPYCFGAFRVHDGSKSTGEKGINYKMYEDENNKIRMKYDPGFWGRVIYKYYSTRSLIAKKTKYRKIFN